MNSLEQWFEGFTALKTVNLVNLKTSEVKNFDKMFYNCSSLSTLIIDGTFTVTEDASTTDMFPMYSSSMFYGTLSVRGSTSPNINKNIFANVISNGRLETEEKFEIDGIGSDVDGATYLITYKGGMFNSYNDYHPIVIGQYGHVFTWSPLMAAVGQTVTISLAEDYQGYTPKATYEANQEITRLTVTETNDGCMAAARVLPL